MHRKYFPGCLHVLLQVGRKGRALLISMTCLVAFPCFADQILFQNPQGPQTGVVVREDDRSVTIKFPRGAIKSIDRAENPLSNDGADKVVWQEEKDYLILKIPRSSIQVSPAAAAPDTTHEEAFPVSATTPKAQQELLQEEMGGVRGVILWQGEPLRQSRVKIVLERYTGFSMAALKRAFAAEGENASNDDIVLETRTDTRGRYIFSNVPPGYYRLYWMPDAGAGWVHRLREEPDLEVISGKPTIADIPQTSK